MDEPIRAAAALAGVLNRLGVRHMIVGSAASTFYGHPRMTEDVDVVAELLPEHIEQFAITASELFHVDPDMVRDAVLQHDMFNISLWDGFTKVDIYVADGSARIRRELDRRLTVTLTSQPEAPELVFASPEDVIVRKVQWGIRSYGVSDKQWQDVLGVLTEQDPWLDLDYLRMAAAEAGVSEQVEAAIQQAGIAED